MMLIVTFILIKFILLIRGIEGEYKVLLGVI